MIREMFYNEAHLFLKDIKNSIVRDMPPAYMDDMNYGFFADSVARNTGMHPAVCLAIYANIEPFINKQEDISIREMSARLKNRSDILTGEVREALVYRHGLAGDPTSSQTQESARQISEKIPISLSYLKGRAEYIIPQEKFQA